MKLFAMMAALFLSACAMPPQQSAHREPTKITEPTPRCSGKVECERMWIAAQEGIEIATRMKVRSVTDTRIDTYPARTFGYLEGRVVKYPIDSNIYEIRATFLCYGRTDCSDLRASATNFFNNLVGGKPN